VAGLCEVCHAATIPGSRDFRRNTGREALLPPPPHVPYSFHMVVAAGARSVALPFYTQSMNLLPLL
jgi:hypothetical protein